MASGVSIVWLITWSLWAAVVYKDFRREPKDSRRLVSLVALVVLAYATRDSLREANLRFGLLSTLAVLVLTVWTISDLLTSRRIARLANWASQNDFEAVALGPKRSSESLPHDLSKLKMLAKGSFPFTVGVLKKETDAESETFVFRHNIRRRIVWYDVSGIEATGTVVAIHRPGARLPRFQLRPVWLLPWMDGGLVGDVVAVPAGSSFSKSYRLGSDEPRNLRRIFTDELLASIAEHPGCLIEGEGEWIAAFTFDRSESLMALKTSKLRTVSLADLDGYTRELGAKLASIASRSCDASAESVDAA